MRYALLLVSMLAGALYLGVGNVVVKALAVGCLALMVWTTLNVRTDTGIRLLAFGLSFCTLGDILLSLGRGLFTAGLGAFLVGHLFYLRAFQLRWPHPLRTAPWQQALRAAVILAALVLAAQMWPHLGDMKIPVATYIVAITLMTVSAILAGQRLPLVPAGAILFLISDSVLGWNRFVEPLAGSGFIVWTTYYAAQLLITFGYVRVLR